MNNSIIYPPPIYPPGPIELIAVLQATQDILVAGILVIVLLLVAILITKLI